MFIKGICAIYIDKNLNLYENSTVLYVLCLIYHYVIDISKVFLGELCFNPKLKHHSINGAECFKMVLRWS